MPVPLLLALPLLVLGVLDSGNAEAVQAVAVAVDRRGHKRDREDAAGLSRPVRVGEGDQVSSLKSQVSSLSGLPKSQVSSLKYLSLFFVFVFISCQVFLRLL